MQEIDLEQLDSLEKLLTDALNALPKERRAFHQQMERELRNLVDASINAVVHDEGGKIKGYQETQVGSGGGYAAIRPKKQPGGDNGAGAVTNYLENGHNIRRPSGKSKRYYARITTLYVDGRYFYESAARRVETAAIRAAEEFAGKIEKALGG